ncbi:unnamed protein product [marine sediment metagenome]|uniref:Uncharacterized protein n=1 Tax=marine sediment metagenome TaxID=412755 RepID=X1RNK7_9ZZZZ
MISEATVRLVKYPPECIPDSWFGNVPASAEAAPPVLDLRRFTPYILALANIQLAANPNVVLRARHGSGGSIRVEENTAAMLSNLVGAWWLSSKDILYYNLFGLAAVADYKTHFGMWAKGGSPVTPTIVDKLFYGIPLTNDEKAVCEELGIRNTFEKGLLPLPISQQIEREYRIVGEETRSKSITIASASVSAAAPSAPVCTPTARSVRDVLTWTLMPWVAKAAYVASTVKVKLDGTSLRLIPLQSARVVIAEAAMLALSTTSVALLIWSSLEKAYALPSDGFSVQKAMSRPLIVPSASVLAWALKW